MPMLFEATGFFASALVQYPAVGPQAGIRNTEDDMAAFGTLIASSRFRLPSW